MRYEMGTKWAIPHWYEMGTKWPISNRYEMGGPETPLRGFRTPRTRTHSVLGPRTVAS